MTQTYCCLGVHLLAVSIKVSSEQEIANHQISPVHHHFDQKKRTSHNSCCRPLTNTGQFPLRQRPCAHTLTPLGLFFPLWNPKAFAAQRLFLAYRYSSFGMSNITQKRTNGPHFRKRTLCLPRPSRTVATGGSPPPTVRSSRHCRAGKFGSSWAGRSSGVVPVSTTGGTCWNMFHFSLSFDARGQRLCLELLGSWCCFKAQFLLGQADDFGAIWVDATVPHASPRAEPIHHASPPRISSDPFRSLPDPNENQPKRSSIPVSSKYFVTCCCALDTKWASLGQAERPPQRET